MGKWFDILMLIFILVAALIVGYLQRDAETPCERLARYDAIVEDNGRLTPLQLEAYLMLSTLRPQCLHERAETEPTAPRYSLPPIEVTPSRF